MIILTYHSTDIDTGNYYNNALSVYDVDGNGLGDIVITDFSKVHTYYNMGNDNWQFDVIASNIQDYDTAKFIHDDGSKTNFTDQLGDVFSTKVSDYGDNDYINSHSTR